ncbi:uncharacterized protein [Chironomus tepperi]|uniref:uncharacterized protein n=1 Tax=Chironomus tepperi TaxID=113505 RepID=UPI00391F6B6F
MNFLRNSTTCYSLTNESISQNSSLELPIDCSKIRTFCLKDVVLLDSVFMAFLRHFVSLENLDFSYVQIVSTQPFNPDLKIICSRVSDINFEFSSWEIFDYLFTPAISSLRLSSSNLQANSSIISFLKEGVDLKKLELHAVSCDIMEFFKFSRYKFSLKHLGLVSSDYTGEPNTRNDHCFQDFITERAMSVTSLEMKALLSPASLDWIMKRLRNLRQVTLKVNHLILNTSHYYQKKPRKAVKALMLEGSFHNLDMVVALLSLFPCVKLLNFRDAYMDLNIKFLSDVLRYAAVICTDLIELSLTRMICLNPELKFDKLEVLRVGYVNIWDELIAFLNTNYTVQRLYIEHVFRRQINRRAMEMIIKSNIMHLHMSADSYEIQRIFKNVQAIGNGNLITLELTVQSYESKSYTFYYSPGNNNINTAEQLIFDTNAFIIDDLAEHLETL